MQESDKNEIVVIASSTGGPDILKKIIPKLDRNIFQFQHFCVILTSNNNQTKCLISE